jgi:hypothetical protein
MMITHLVENSAVYLAVWTVATKVALKAVKLAFSMVEMKVDP